MLEVSIILCLTIALFVWGKFPPDVVALISMLPLYLMGKLLMPVAFGSNTGGLLILTGTPSNIIVNNAQIENGMEGFSFFEFGLIGLPLLIIAMGQYLEKSGIQLLGASRNNRPLSRKEITVPFLKN